MTLDTKNHFKDSIFTEGRRREISFASDTDQRSNFDIVDETVYQHPEFKKAINEHMDLLDTETRRTLLNMNEESQSTVLTSLTSKLYDNIVDKVDDIDYGEIPRTKGDITKLSNYDKLVDCVELLKGILKEYRQDEKPVDEIAIAISNVKSRKDLFERGYRYNIELPMVVYCNMVLAIIGSVSYLISTCIEFIKTPSKDSFDISLDRTAYSKSKDHLLFDCLKRFNKACDDGSLDKALETVIQQKVKNFSGVAVVGGAIVGIGALLLVVIPIIRDVVFLFYYTKMRVSDFFDIQADLLQMNAYNISANELRNPEEKDEIVKKQMDIAELFRKVSNVFAIKTKKAEVDANREFKAQDKKMKIGDIVDDDVGSVSSLF